MGILTKKQVSVTTVMDMVYISIVEALIVIPYQTAFEIAQRIRLASKQAMQLDNTPHAEHRSIAHIDSDPEFYCHPSFRRSSLVSNVNVWEVGGEGVLVVLKFDDLTVKLDYPDALTLHSWIRVRAKEAKGWAGDRSRTMRGLANLTNAEDNYRIGI